MNVKYIYWFAYFNTSEPSVRYRAVYPLSHLKKQYGIGYSFVYPGYAPLTVLRFLKTYFEVLFLRRRNSVIVFQKIYTAGVYARLLKLLLRVKPKYTVYDIDDAEYVRRPDDTIRYFIQNCAVCAAGSRALMEYILPQNANVFLLTSPVINHSLRKKNRNAVLNIGWIGYYGAHRESLHALLFSSLLKIDFPLKLTLLGVTTGMQRAEVYALFADKNNIEIEMPADIDWYDEIAIYKRIQAFDVGVSPLLNTEFNVAKSAFKLKQCFSCGVPVLASPVGENCSFIEDGKNGYLCHHAEDFFERIVEIAFTADKQYAMLVEEAAASMHRFSMDSYSWVFIKEFLFNGNKLTELPKEAVNV